jgi:GTP-binding protein
LKVAAVDFVRSAAAAADLPRDPLPQVAFVGRSNVGKSTLINALVKQTVARTSAAPGKTRLINLFRVTLASHPRLDRFYLVDLPGYGYTRGGEDAQAEFDLLVHQYFETRPEGPAAVLQLVDIRHPGLNHDVAAHQWLEMQTDRPCAVIATKADKLSRTERVRALQDQQKKMGLKTPPLPVSAAKGDGMDDLWKLIVTLLTPRA